MGDHGGVLLTGDFERKIRFYQVTLFIGESKRNVKEGSGNGLSLHRSPTVEMGRGLVLPRTLRNRWRALEMKCLALWELWNRNLKGGLLYWGYIKEGSGSDHLSPYGALWEPGGGGALVYQTLRDGHRTALERVYTSVAAAKGTWREGFFTGNPESYVKHVKEGFGYGASLSL